MKTQVIVAAMLAFLALDTWAQAKSVKIVFDMSSKDTLAHRTVVRHALLMANSYPQSQFEVVVFSDALPMVVRGKSTVEAGILELAEKKNITFKACAIAMKGNHISKDQLLPGVEVVPDGLIELVTKQGQGWGYIKE